MISMMRDSVPYLFTEGTTKILEVRRCRDGYEALARRLVLAKELRRPVYAWACMGGQAEPVLPPRNEGGEG